MAAKKIQDIDYAFSPINNYLFEKVKIPIMSSWMI